VPFDYGQLNGGVTQSITRRATEEYDRLAKDDEGKPLSDSEAQTRKMVLRWIMLRMVAISGGEFNRRKVPMTELVYPEPNNRYVKEVISRFEKARLLFKDIGKNDQDVYVEPAHDVLIREWVQINEWIKMDQEDLALQQRLIVAANDWKESHGMLWTEEAGRLARLEKVLESNNNWLNELEKKFVEESISKRQDELKKTKEQLRISEERRKTAETAVSRQLAAQAEQSLSKDRSLVHSSLLLAVESLRRYPTLEGNQALQRSIAWLARLVTRTTHEANVKAVAIEGKYLAIAADDWTVQVFELTNRQPLATMKLEGVVEAVAFTPGGKYLATAYNVDEKTISGSHDRVSITKVWDWKDRKCPIAENPPELSRVLVVAFSPDGKYLATTYSSGEDSIERRSCACVTKVWDWQEKLEASRPIHHDSKVQVVAFSQDAKYLAAGTYLEAQVWEWKDKSPKILKSITNTNDIPGKLWTIAFSPDGRYFAAASNTENTNAGMPHYTSSRAQVWGMWGSSGSWKLVSTTMEHNEVKVNALAFSLDGKYLSAASDSDFAYDQNAFVWDVETGGNVAIAIRDYEFLNDGTRPSRSLVSAFSSDGKYLAMSFNNGTTRVWQMPGCMEHQNVSSIAFSPNGKYLATANNYSTKIFEVSSSQPVACINTDAGSAVAFSQNGRYFAIAGRGGTARVWKWDGANLQDEVCINHDNGNSVELVTFSPNGEYLATVTNTRKGYTTQVWEWQADPHRRAGLQISHKSRVRAIAFVGNGKRLATAGHYKAQVWNWKVYHSNELKNTFIHHGGTVVAFSSTGEFLVIVGSNGIPSIWKTTSGEKVTPVQTRHDVLYNQSQFSRPDFLSAIAISPDGKHLATASTTDQTLRVWEVESKQEVARMRYKGAVKAIAFSADRNGKYIATADMTAHSACLWLWQPKDLILEACTRLVCNLTPEEWSQYVGDERYRKTCPNLPIDPIAAQDLVEEGRSLAKEGKIKSAIAKFVKALKLNSRLSFDPKAEAQQFKALGLVEEAERLIEQGQVEKALDLCREAQTIAPTLQQVSAGSWYTICWFGSLHGHAAEVISFCENAVAIEPSDGIFRNSRGLARTLTGDIEGAIEDFQAFIDWVENDEEKLRPQRWISVLRVGQNPFTATEIEALLEEAQ